MVVSLLIAMDHFGVVLMVVGGVHRAVGLGVLGLALVCPMLKVGIEDG